MLQPPELYKQNLGLRGLRVPGKKKLQYFRIKNWEKYQSRDHKKSMPWFKLYTGVFDDAKIMNLGDNHKLVWIGLLISAAQGGNELPWSSRRLRSKLGFSCFVNLDLFESLGLIERYQHNTQRVENSYRQEERRGEEIRKKRERVSALTESEFITLKKKQNEIKAKLKNAQGAH